jgi:hypothetical protein
VPDEHQEVAGGSEVGRHDEAGIRDERDSCDDEGRRDTVTLSVGSEVLVVERVPSR